MNTEIRQTEMGKKSERIIVIFGAGKIGRSFIGQLFSRSGFVTVFIDSNKPLVDELNMRGNYNVVIKGDREEILLIENVRALHSEDRQSVTDLMAGSDIVAVSAGQTALSNIIPLLAEGLLKRYSVSPGYPLDIIIAENMRNGAGYFREKLKDYLPEWYPLNDLAGLIETSIGKMVPIMLSKDLSEDMLKVYAEPYNTLILDGRAFKNPIPDVKGLAPKSNIKAWVDRKLFIHNLGHATTAYLGHIANPEYVYLFEAMDDKSVFCNVRETMLQAAEALIAEYPEEFTKSDLVAHTDDLLSRFQNRALGDTIFRVGCDLMRKLAGDDRIAGAIKLAIKHNLTFDRILHSLVCGYHFRAVDEKGKLFPEDILFGEKYSSGIEPVLREVCSFNDYEMSLILGKAIEEDQLFR